MNILYYYIQLIINKLMRYTSLGLRPIAHIDNTPISTFLELTQPCRCKRLSLYISESEFITTNKKNPKNYYFLTDDIFLQT